MQVLPLPAASDLVVAVDKLVVGWHCHPVLCHCHLSDSAGHPQHPDLREHQVVGVRVVVVCDCDVQNVLEGRGRGKDQSLGRGWGKCSGRWPCHGLR